MSEKKMNARVLNKHDTRTNWSKATGFIPKPGEIIIYDKDPANGDDSGYPKFKVGNGIDIPIDLPFATGDLPMEKGAGVDAVQQKGCTASGDYSFAEGNATNATGVKSHAEGARTTASNAAAHAEGADTTASGDSSHAEGYLTTASNKYSHAEGYETTASGLYAHAEGYKTKATAMSTHAEGDTSIACGQFSHAEGSGTIAGNTSTNPGVVWNNKTLGNFTHAEGNGTRARGNSSHSEGKATNALGLASHSEGELTEASGDHSHAEGYSTIATGVKSHAEGQQTEASGIAAHAEGGANKATAQGAHAEGWNTQATGSVAHSEGVSTIASGRASHAGGEGTKASAQWQTAIGKYNAEEDTALFIVGNGSSDTDRKNCFSAGADADGAYAKIGDKEVATKDDIPNLNGVEFKEGEMDIPLKTRNGPFGEEAIPYNINAKSSLSINAVHTNGVLDDNTAWKDRNIISYLDYDPITPGEKYTDILTIGTEPATQADTESTAIREVHIKGKNIILTPELEPTDAEWFKDASPAMEITGIDEPIVNTYGKLYYNGSEVTTKVDIDSKADKATTLEGYGITDGATKTELDKKLSSSGINSISNNFTLYSDDIGDMVMFVNRGEPTLNALPSLSLGSTSTEATTTISGSLVYIKSGADGGPIGFQSVDAIEVSTEVNDLGEIAPVTSVYGKLLYNDKEVATKEDLENIDIPEVNLDNVLPKNGEVYDIDIRYKSIYTEGNAYSVIQTPGDGIVFGYDGGRRMLPLGHKETVVSGRHTTIEVVTEEPVLGIVNYPAINVEVDPETTGYGDPSAITKISGKLLYNDKEVATKEDIDTKADKEHTHNSLSVIDNVTNLPHNIISTREIMEYDEPGDYYWPIGIETIIGSEVIPQHNLTGSNISDVSVHTKNFEVSIWNIRPSDEIVDGERTALKITNSHTGTCTDINTDEFTFKGKEVATKEDIDTKFGPLATGTTTNGESYIKVGSTTLTETQLIKILKFIESVEEVNE